MKKLVVFDLDGTLIDSVPDIADCVNVMLEKYNHLPCTYDEVAQMIGNGARNLVKAAVKCELSDKEIDERLDFYSKIYTDCGSPKTKVFDGVKETLFELIKRGYEVAIFTNKPQSATHKVCEIYLQNINFFKVVGISPEVKRKPNPDVLFAMMEELSISPENTYFVGDGEADVEVSKNAGVNGISVLYGYRTREQLQAVGATTFVNTATELLEILK
jgi:phosphoglycolate phosphatase